MNDEEKKKFAFHCGVIDKLFGQIDAMSNWNECLLENFYEKVTHSLQVLDRFDTFFEDYNEYFAYIDKGSQVQSKLKSLQTGLSSRLDTNKSVTSKAANELSGPNLEESKSLQPHEKTVISSDKTVPVAEENASSASNKTIDYSKIPDSAYKLLIDGPVSQSEENHLAVKDTSLACIAIGLSKLELSLAQEANSIGHTQSEALSMSKKNKKTKNKVSPNDSQPADSLGGAGNSEQPCLVGRGADSSARSTSLARRQSKSSSPSKIMPPPNRFNPNQVHSKPNEPHSSNLSGVFQNKHPNYSFSRPFSPAAHHWREEYFEQPLYCCCQFKYHPPPSHQFYSARGHCGNRGKYNYQHQSAYANRRPSFSQVPNNEGSSSHTADKKLTNEQQK